MLTRVIGVGNMLHRDEGVGVEAVERLRPLVADRDDVEVCDGGTAGFGLLDLLVGAPRVILIDGVDLGEQPGTLFRFTGAELVADGGNGTCHSLHGIGVPEVVALARGGEMEPAEIILYGVQVADLRPGIGLSPAVSPALPGLLERVLEELGGGEST